MPVTVVCNMEIMENPCSLPRRHYQSQRRLYTVIRAVEKLGMEELICEVSEGLLCFSKKVKFDLHLDEEVGDRR